MPWKKVGSAVVIAARQFNPSVIKQLWLVKRGVLSEDDCTEGCVFSDEFVQVRTAQFNLLVVPPQLQYSPTVVVEEEQQQIVTKLGTIVKELPHTPYSAIGLNVTWNLTPTDHDISGMTRRLFYQPDKPLFQIFDTPDSHFGSYLSKDFQGFRLKLDVKPVHIAAEDVPAHVEIQFSFNFHHDLNENAAEEIQANLLKWNDIVRETERIVDAVERREGT